MESGDLTEIRNKRLYATRVAAHISMMSRKTGVPIQQLAWEHLPTLPQWCLADSKDRQSLQLVCGTLLLAPLIRNSINGSVLRRLREFVGHDLFQFACETYAVEHEIHRVLDDRQLEVTVMGSGSLVLLSMLEDKSLVKLYTAIIGPPAQHQSSENLSTETASRIHSSACQFIETPLQESPDRNVA